MLGVTEAAYNFSVCYFKTESRAAHTSATRMVRFGRAQIERQIPLVRLSFTFYLSLSDPMPDGLAKFPTAGRYVGLNLSPMSLSSKRRGGKGREEGCKRASSRVLKFARLNVACSVKFRPRSVFIRNGRSRAELLS